MLYELLKCSNSPVAPPLNCRRVPTAGATRTLATRVWTAHPTTARTDDDAATNAANVWRCWRLKKQMPICHFSVEQCLVVNKNVSVIVQLPNQNLHIIVQAQAEKAKGMFLFFITAAPFRFCASILQGCLHNCTLVN
jgi:hypothetical protein